MHRTGQFGYWANESLQVLELPYANNGLAMTILLPTKIDGLPELEREVTHGKLRQWTKNLIRQKVVVFLPKFKTTSQFGFNDTLQAMGMTLAFDQEKADFSGMSRMKGTNDGDLYIKAILHKAFVDVNEEGTEAAAASGVVMGFRSARLRPEQPPEFRADHPFMFLIRENQTGTILFMGRLANPKE